MDESKLNSDYIDEFQSNINCLKHKIMNQVDKWKITINVVF